MPSLAEVIFFALTSWGILSIAGVVPLVIIVKVKNRQLRLMSAVLAAFLFSHATFHIVLSLDEFSLALGILWPLSIGLLVVFGVMLLRRP